MDRPVVSSSEAAAQVGNFVTVYGQVIEVRRVFKGPVIFEIDGKPAAPQFRALVYPMAVSRFGSDPENVYLGKMVEVKGVVQVRKDLPQMWINDPTHIQLRKSPGEAQPTASPTTTPQAGQ